MGYAVIKTGGKQYKVTKDLVIEVERLPYKTGENFSFREVLLYVADKDVKLGKPKLGKATVKATVLEHFRGDKIRVAKFKAKSKYRKVTGHRQALTRVKIGEILSSEKSKKK